MQEMFNRALDLIVAYLPNLIGPIAILVIGFLIAFVVAALVRMALRRTTLDSRLTRLLFGDEADKSVPVENAISKGVFYLLMIFVLVEFFQALQLTAITGPLNKLLDTTFAYLPSLFGAGVLLLIAWMLATVLRRVMLVTLQGAKLDERLACGQADTKTKCAPLSKTLSDVVYWVVFILFLPLILDALRLQGALEPIKTLLNRVFDFVPSIIGAGLIILIGWFLARLIRQVVSNLLAAAGLDRLSDRLGLSETLGELKLSGLIGLVLYVLILIPVIIAGLSALKLDAVTQPASAMLGKIMDALPLMFGAALVLVISYIVARIVATLVTNVLAGMGFNNVLINLGITKKPTQGGKTPAAIVGMLALATIMILASIEASRMLKFDTLADLLAKLLVFGGHILMGLIILGVGMFLANVVAKSVLESGRANAGMLATAARVVVLVLAGAMALRQMDIANEIVNLAFGLLLGAVAVAVALAFGLGGRESAAKLIEEWRASTKGK
ncbi:MAG: mechanosensitive ion channel [Verrucomicrobiia bacterium]